jgi:Protein of unknown function (DUF732)
MTISRARSATQLRALPARLAPAAALLSMAVAVVPAAHADAIDNAFLAAVRAKGVNFATAEAAVVAGHEVCDELDLGKQKSDVANEVMTNSGLDAYRAGFFVGASVAAFCPRYRGS